MVKICLPKAKCVCQGKIIFLIFSTHYNIFNFDSSSFVSKDMKNKSFTLPALNQQSCIIYPSQYSFNHRYVIQNWNKVLKRLKNKSGGAVYFPLFKICSFKRREHHVQSTGSLMVKNWRAHFFFFPWWKYPDLNYFIKEVDPLPLAKFECSKFHIMNF